MTNAIYPTAPTGPIGLTGERLIGAESLYRSFRSAVNVQTDALDAAVRRLYNASDRLYETAEYAEYTAALTEATIVAIRARAEETGA